MKTIEFNDIFDLMDKVVEEVNAANKAGEEAGVIIVATDCKKVKVNTAGTNEVLINSLTIGLGGDKSKRFSQIVKTAVLIDSSEEYRKFINLNKN